MSTDKDRTEPEKAKDSVRRDLVISRASPISRYAGMLWTRGGF
jgi:hypothetical protein